MWLPSDYDKQLFVDPVIGSPLIFFLHDDIRERETFAEIIESHGGQVASEYASAAYILGARPLFLLSRALGLTAIFGILLWTAHPVDAKTEGGQSLGRLFANEKHRLVLDFRWVTACVRANDIVALGHSSNWGGYRLNVQELSFLPAADSNSAATSTATPSIAALDLGDTPRSPAPPVTTPLKSTSALQPDPAATGGGDTQTILKRSNPFALKHATGSFLLPPIENDQTTSLLSQMLHPAAFASIPASWPAADQASLEAASEILGPAAAGTWDGSGQSLDPDLFFADATPFSMQTHDALSTLYFSEPSQAINALHPMPSANALTAAEPMGPVHDARPLKRKGTEAGANELASSMRIRPLDPTRRSPSPPRNPVPSVHGGYAFTEDDVAYLHNYISYCKDIGLPLSLREICERLAEKAPHHSFYSWRRYCDKHKVQLGGYETLPTPSSELEERPPLIPSSSSPFGINSPATRLREFDPGGGSESEKGVEQGDAATASSVVLIAGTGGLLRYRHQRLPSSVTSGDDPPIDEFFQRTEPQPPAILYKSKSGKGVAFTRADVEFLVRFIAFRRAEHMDNSGGTATLADKDGVNLTRLWSDLAAKATHHSRESWIKFWRRHKHELEFSDSFISMKRPELQSLSSSDHSSPLQPTADASAANACTTGSPAPRKRQRYSHEDDILLARFFAANSFPSSPAFTPPIMSPFSSAPMTPVASSSTSTTTTASDGEVFRRTPFSPAPFLGPTAVLSSSRDVMFREFARLHPQHPAKGWQEHYRMRKMEIEQLISQLQRNEEIQ